VACNGETDFQFLAEHSLDILCRASLDRTLVYISPSSVHVLGWKPEEMTGRPASEFIHPEDLPSSAQLSLPSNIPWSFA
jgi:PAS domain S-box-containing protein